MQTVDELEISYTQLESPKIKTRLTLFDRLEQRKTILLIAMVALAFCVRVYRLDEAGLAEDEANKIFAVRVYHQGDFTVNSEHPMVMKMLSFISLELSDVWNRLIRGRAGLAIAEETALRLPNVLFGALTVIPLLLFTTAILGFRVGLISSLLWTLGLNAIWFNRVGKEDTLLVFFMFVGFYFYYRAKSEPASNPAGEEKFFALAGMAFGLMLASKYFPHFLGLSALFYNIIGNDSQNNRPKSGRIKLIFFGSIILSIAIFNWAAFVPQTWRYLLAWLREDLLTHHGYRIGDSLYPNDLTDTPGGMPWYFYFLYLGVKIPLPLLIAFAVGVFEIFRRRIQPDAPVDKPGFYGRGYLFLRMMVFLWLIPMAIMGAKFLRYTLTLMPFVYMTAAVGIVVIWRVIAGWMKRLSFEQRIARIAIATTVVAVFIVAPSIATLNSLPTPSLFMNAIGGNRAGYFFPHDEFYDLGARESIKYIADNAPEGITIASEVPGVVQYYLQKYNRTDIKSLAISHPEFSLARSRPYYVLLQPGRVYFENQEIFKFIERTYPVVQASTYEGVAASQVYKVTDGGPPDAGMAAGRQSLR